MKRALLSIAIAICLVALVFDTWISANVLQRYISYCQQGISLTPSGFGKC